MLRLERIDSGLAPPALPVFTTTPNVDSPDISVYSDTEPESDFDFDDPDSDYSSMMNDITDVSLTKIIVHTDPVICGEARWHTVSSPNTSSRARAFSTAGALPEIDTTPFTCDFSPLFITQPELASDSLGTRGSPVDTPASDALPLPENAPPSPFHLLDLSLPEPELDIPLYGPAPRRRSTGSLNHKLEIPSACGPSVLPVLEHNCGLRPRSATPPLPRRSPLRNVHSATMHMPSPRDSAPVQT